MRALTRNSGILRSSACQRKLGHNSFSTRMMARGPEGVQRAPHDAGKIDRVIKSWNVRRQFAPQFPHAGGGGGGDDELKGGQARFQGADQLRANAHFAHADGVQPENGAVASGGFRLPGRRGQNAARNPAANWGGGTFSENTTARSARRKGRTKYCKQIASYLKKTSQRIISSGSMIGTAHLNK